MFRFEARAIGACCFLAVAMSATAVADDAGGMPPAGELLTLKSAIARALDGNPALQGFVFKLQANKAQTVLARQRPAPELALEIANVFGSGDVSGFDGAETTLALSQVVEFGAKRERRGEAAEAAVLVVETERQIAQLDVLAEVTRRFITVVALQERQLLQAEATELATRTVRDVERRVRAARSPEAELLRARAALAEVGIEAVQLRGALAVARRQLAAQWGATDDFGPLAAELYAVRDPEPFDTLAAKLAANPDFLRFASETRLRDAELRLAQSQRRPDVEFAGGVRRLADIDEQALVLGVTVPFGTSRRATPAIAAATAARELSIADRAAAEIRARTQLYEFHQELQLAVAAVRSLRGEVLPALDAALEQSRYAYERGRYSYLEFSDAQNARRLAQQRLLDAAERSQLLWIEVERLTGQPVEEGR